MSVVDGTASAAVSVPCSRYYLHTGSPTCDAAAVGPWSAMMGVPFCCLYGRSPSRSSSRNEREQKQRAVRRGSNDRVIV